MVSLILWNSRQGWSERVGVGRSGSEVAGVGGRGRRGGNWFGGVSKRRALLRNRRVGGQRSG